MRDDPGRSRRRPPFWDHQRHLLVPLSRAIESVAREEMGLAAGQRVIDLGCGDRPYEPFFRRLGCDYVGCDLEGEGVVLIRPGQPVPLADGTAHAVVSFQVLEHVWDLDWYLGEAHRLLAPDGRLLLSTHGAWLYHPHPADYRRWTRDGLVGELEARGFAVEKIEALVGPLAWTTLFRLLGMREALLRLPLVGRPLVALAAAVMNSRMILEDRLTPASIRETNAAVYVALCRRRGST